MAPQSRAPDTPVPEEATIGEKIRDTRALDYPEDRLEIIICDDGSIDRTAEIAARHSGVTVIRNPRNAGKATSLSRLVEAATGDILLLTDASARLSQGCLRRLVRALDDPAVGAAGARYIVGDKETASVATEAGYWGLEDAVRGTESSRDLLLGLAGAAYVVRRPLMPELPADTINDDWVIPATIRGAGHRVVYVPDAIAVDEPTSELRGLYNRWVRIAFGNMQMLWRLRALPFQAPRLWLPLARKTVRTGGPIILAALACAVILLALQWMSPWVVGASCAGALAAALALLLSPDRGANGSGALRFVRVAIVAQLAYLVGFGRALFGRRAGLWRKADLPTRPSFDRPAPIPLSVRVTKRLLDLVAAVSALVLLSPVLLALVVWIRLDSTGPAIYRQTRECPGPDGLARNFTMYKFRTMREDAEALTGPILAAEGDPRITGLGRSLRKHRLDELPQFYNVLRGEMSLVGPRPERPSLAKRLGEDIPGYDDRVLVHRPGITGWAQVQCGYDTGPESVDEKLSHDMAYIAHLYSFPNYLRMEVKVIWRTFRVVLTGKGAR